MVYILKTEVIKISKNKTVICRKIQITPFISNKKLASDVNDPYEFIKNAQEAQNRALNLVMSEYASEFYRHGADPENAQFKEWEKKNMNNSNPLLSTVEFGTGMDTASQVIQKVKKDFKTALDNGLCDGERSINNYKKNVPLMTRGRNLRFYHEYGSSTDLLYNIESDDLKVYIRWIHGISFKVVLGNARRSNELRTVLLKILEEEYEVLGSSISVQFDDKNKKQKLILNLSLSVPVNKPELREDVVVGVDLGIAIPAYCGLNTDPKAKQAIGKVEDLLRVRTQLQNQRRQLQHSLARVKGGHGRKKKLASLTRLKKKERNFVQTYNHMISKRVVDFARRNYAKYINLEYLKGYHSNEFVLRNWSYYELQKDIEYKAALEGITVRKINPYLTSQTCSKCGHYEKGQRSEQAKFLCKSCGYEENADFNASRNIAMSTDFVKKKKKSR